jgi:hypothetical protein
MGLRAGHQLHASNPGRTEAAHHRFRDRLAAHPSSTEQLDARSAVNASERLLDNRIATYRVGPAACAAEHRDLALPQCDSDLQLPELRRPARGHLDLHVTVAHRDLGLDRTVHCDLRARR